MSKTDSVPGSHTKISKDKMRLTVTDVHPAFRKRSDEETRKEISERLFRIFKKYA